MHCGLTLNWAAFGKEQLFSVMLFFIILVTKVAMSYIQEVKSMNTIILTSAIDIFLTITCSRIANALPA